MAGSRCIFARCHRVPTRALISAPALTFGGHTVVFVLQVPWEALRALLGQSIYGGRVDSPFDQQLLESFVCSLFQPQSFDLNFPLCR